MDFNDALDAVKNGISQQNLADRLGVSVQRVRQARLDPASDGYRPPPTGWREALAALAQERGGSFLDIANSLADQMEADE